ncbi:Uncharacterised protein [Serratia fonticola]|nr:Uncharacterised protein [Serratia fonticola]
MVLQVVLSEELRPVVHLALQEACLVGLLLVGVSKTQVMETPVIKAEVIAAVAAWVEPAGKPSIFA